MADKKPTGGRMPRVQRAPLRSARHLADPILIRLAAGDQRSRPGSCQD
ncbi:MAG: hypothetical protein LC769_04205 [Chloroflexi bacterium]|nr:hypothetical protein [Chloroflexota bacterium]